MHRVETDNIAYGQIRKSSSYHRTNLQDSQNSWNILPDQPLLDILTVHQPNSLDINLHILAIWHLNARHRRLPRDSVGEKGTIFSKDVFVNYHLHSNPFLAIQNNLQITRAKLPKSNRDLMLLWSLIGCRCRCYLWWIRGSNNICWRAYLLI